MEELSESVQILKTWIQQQPHLPQRNSDAFLIKFYISCNYRIEVTKTLLEIFYCFRSKYTEIFFNRDFNSPVIQDCIEIMDIFKLPHNLGNSRILVSRMNSSDVSKYNFLAAAQVFTIFDDALLMFDETIVEEDIVLIDLDNMTLKHLPRITVSIAKKMFEYVQEVRPTNLKEIHCLNVPSYIGAFLMVIKPFVKGEVFNMINFHSQKSTTLHNFIPKELLPEEYGGTCGKIADFKKESLELVKKNLNVILDDSFWQLDETKRKCSSKTNILQEPLKN